jgi:hypothetical protein
MVPMDLQGGWTMSASRQSRTATFENRTRAGAVHSASGRLTTTADISTSVGNKLSGDNTAAQTGFSPPLISGRDGLRAQKRLRVLVPRVSSASTHKVKESESRQASEEKATCGITKRLGGLADHVERVLWDMADLRNEKHYDVVFICRLGSWLSLAGVYISVRKQYPPPSVNDIFLPLVMRCFLTPHMAFLP